MLTAHYPKPPRRLASLVDEFGGFCVSPEGDAMRLPRNPIRELYYTMKLHFSEVLS